MSDNAITDAVILFTDIRGFTRWADAPDIFPRLDNFIKPFGQIIRDSFPDATFVKSLGDGAMIVQEISAGSDLAALLTEKLATIKKVDASFAALCSQFANEVGHHTELDLAWAIVRGQVMRVNGDYVGSNVNKAARLCDLARPAGIVIDKDDFTASPSTAQLRFYAQTRSLSGLDAASVWVTEEIQFQFIPRERLRQSPEVHVAGFCIDAGASRLRVLLARRSDRRALYPGLIEGCGGQLQPNESFEQGVQRHFKKELDLEVRVFKDLHLFYEIREPNQPLIPGIRFLCELNEAHKIVSSRNHSAVQWVSATEFRAMPETEFIPGLKREALQLIKRYKEMPKPKSSKQAA